MVSAVLTLILIAAILYGAAHIAVRTDGLKYTIEEKLAEHTGIAATFESIRLSWDLGVLFHGMELPSGDTPGCGPSRADWIAWHSEDGLLSWPLGTGKELVVERPELVVCRAEDGRWAPRQIADKLRPVLAALREQYPGLPADAFAAGGGSGGDPSAEAGPAEPERVDPAPRGLPDDQAYRISGGRIVWRDAAGGQLGVADPIHLDWRPVPVPGRAAWYGRVDIGTFRWGPWGVSDIQLEWLQIGGDRVLLSFRMQPDPGGRR